VTGYTDPSNQHKQSSANNGSPTAGIATDQTNQAANNTNKPEYAPFWRKVFAWPNGFGTLVIALTLFFIAWQAMLMRQTIISSEDFSQRELRAYVVCEMVSIVNVAECPETIAIELRTAAHLNHPQNGPYAELRIKNAGQTPAYKVRHWGDMCVREYPLTGTLAEVGRTGKPMPMVLGPGIFSTKNFRNIPPLNEGQKADLRSGRGAIYIHGEILYEDAFGKERSTRYRFIHNSITGLVGLTTDMTFCEEGNEAN
jgi:hypothetical protein